VGGRGSRTRERRLSPACLPGRATITLIRGSGGLRSGTMRVRLIYAGSAEVPVERFVAAWLALDLVHGEGMGFPDRPLEVRAEQATFAQQLRSGRALSLDVLCRCLAPNAPSDTMMASRSMQEANERVILVDRSVEPYTARLSPEALRLWQGLSARKRSDLLKEALAAIEPTMA
jgi:hypothetical protein